MARTAVHPFEDGNGRVGRLLRSLMLMREGSPAARLLHDWRARSIHGLNQATTGTSGPLVNLIGRAVEAGLDLYLEACAAPAGSQPLRELVEASGYPLESLSWLARQGRLEAVKRGGRWYSTLEAIERVHCAGRGGQAKARETTISPLQNHPHRNAWQRCGINPSQQHHPAMG